MQTPNYTDVSAQYQGRGMHTLIQSTWNDEVGLLTPIRPSDVTVSCVSDLPVLVAE
jgi:hypothetical protein